MSKNILIVLVTLAFVFGVSPLAMADNEVDIDQAGGVAGGTYNVINYADIAQVGSDNKIEIGQVADTYNEAWACQVGSHNEIVIQQDAGTYNYAYVEQEGNNNKLVGAFTDWTILGTGIDYGDPATQDSSSSYNELTCIQSGDYNEVGLRQEATGTGYNLVDIYQYNGGNSLVIYQTNSGGYNKVTAKQSGGMIARVFQNNYSLGGWLELTVTQGP